MDIVALAKNIEAATDSMAKKELKGITLETCDVKLLEIDEAAMSDHVSLQPIAIAFWGASYKQALRNYERVKRDYEMWRRSKYAAAKDAITGKCTISEVEAKLEAENMDEVKKWIAQVDAAEDLADKIEIWYKAWSQKGYSIKEHSDIHIDETYQTGSINGNNGQQSFKTPETKESMQVRTQRIRDMIKNK